MISKLIGMKFKGRKCYRERVFWTRISRLKQFAIFSKSISPSSKDAHAKKEEWYGTCTRGKFISLGLPRLSIAAAIRLRDIFNMASNFPVGGSLASRAILPLINLMIFLSSVRHPEISFTTHVCNVMSL